jgi:type I restriction enzyme S subunit
MQRFDEHVNPCIEGRRVLVRKNEVLRATRDLLLPKLISGELDVEDSDIDLGMTAEALEEAVSSPK